MLHLLRDNLTRAQMRMRSQANAHRSNRSFKVNDWVLLRLQPYRQLSVRGRSSPKLAKRYVGPFRVLRIIGTIAYELDLPPEARIHPVFHISKLRPYRGAPPTQPPSLPVTLKGTHLHLSLHRILGSQTLRSPRGDRRQLLIQWEGLPELEVTWEDELNFLEAYPTHNLEGKVELQEGVNDIRSKETLVGTSRNRPEGENEPNERRPKRNIKQPTWLNGFV